MVGALPMSKCVKVLENEGVHLVNSSTSAFQNRMFYCLHLQGIEGVQGPVHKMADYGEDNQSFSMHEMSEGVKGPGQDMASCGETNSSESESLGEEMRKDMAGHGETNSYESLSEEMRKDMAGQWETNSSESLFTLDQNDFANPPSKKLKCLQSSVLDDQFPSQAISSSLISECLDSLSSELDVEPLESSPLQPKRIVNSVTYDHIPQDYTLTELDCCAQCVIQNAKEDDILVQIDEISIKKRFLKCLLDENKWLDDKVISAYICCLKEQAHVQNQNDSKVYYENPFVTRLLKQDGQSGIDGPTSMTKVVKNYLNHDMVHLPINIIESHWYLATANFERCEFQVLDSLCWEHNRAELTYMIQGLQHHLDILKSEENSIDPKWKEIDFTKWTIIEQFQAPIQMDSSSCGLFILKFMEYWTGHTLSNVITQKIITKFRFKLAAMLLCWKNNTAPPTTTIEESDYDEEDANDIMISDSPFDDNQPKEMNSLFAENKYMSLMSVLSTLSIHELVSGLCNYIRSIKSAKVLEKIWVQSSLPYPISLTLKKLQGMLNEELTMDFHCFNLAVRMIMFDNIETVKKKGGFISKHCLDMQFWMITDFGRHPNYRKELDVEQLASSIRSWPGMKYNISSCKSVHIPIKSNTGGYILFILDKETRSVYILDPSPIEEMYKLNPHANYVKRILWIAEHLPRAMSKECPGSPWKENIFLWQQNIVNDISFYKRELSGFLVTLFMSTWNDGKLHLPFIKDGYELRKQIVGQLLTIKKNTCEKNMPTGVLDFINCIRKIQNK